MGQNRKLTNAGLRSDLSYVKGIHNIKLGAVYQQTFLDEQDTLGIVDPTLLPSLRLSERQSSSRSVRACCRLTT